MKMGFKNSQVHPDTLLSWLKRQVVQYEDLVVDDLTSSFKDGLVLCAVIHRYRPDLLDFNTLKKDDMALNNQLAFDILEKELGIPPVMTGQEMADCAIPDLLTMLSYLTQIYDTFRGEIPHIKHPKLDIPEVKKVEKTLQPRDFTNVPRVQISAGPTPAPRNYAKHRRYGELQTNSNLNAESTERKTRKRRSGEKVGISVEERQKRLQEISSNRNERMSKRKQQRKKQTERFIKSMQMLHANAKFEEGVPFEDYSLFLYRQSAPNFEDRVKELEQKLLFPDREVKLPGNQLRGEKDEDFSGRIKDFEEKLRETAPQEKKPKDLYRAIGKIESTDWNVKEIEKKIIENKMGKSVNKEKERVPKWSSEQFHARRTKMEKRGLEKQDSEDKKFAAIDKSLKMLDQKLKEGNIREHTHNKVSAITENFKKQPEPEPKPIQKSNSKVIVPAPGGSENCHFCTKRVYLMERLSAEGRFFHRGCFRCQYCNITLRLGSYLFDRDGKYGHKFYCSQHFGMTGQLKGNKIVGKGHNKQHRNQEKIRDVTGVDLIDRVQTPERAEFSTGGISDHEESYSQMDEDEWTDRNFGASTAEFGSSDDDSSDSDSESEDDELFEEAVEEPVTKEGTHRLAKEWVKRYSKDAIDDDDDSPDDYDTGSDFSYENSSDDDESDTATEGEEEIRARELRKQEVRVKQPIVQTDTGSDTEVKNLLFCQTAELSSTNELFVDCKDSDSPIHEPVVLNGCEKPPDVIKNEISNLVEEQNDKKIVEKILPDVISNVKASDVDNNNVPVDNIISKESPVAHKKLPSSVKSSPASPRKLSQTKSPVLAKKPPDNNKSAIKNFIKQKSFDQSFPKLFTNDDQPLLIIKRTPSKINVPKEAPVLKPRIASLANIENAKKYFGDPKPQIKRTERPKTTIGLVNIVKPVEKKPTIQAAQRPSFEFEPKDEDLEEVDKYIEDLLTKEEELLIPIVAPIIHATEDDEELETEEKLSESIEDLLKALEIETGLKDDPISQNIPQQVEAEKIDDLLNWITELEHQPEDQKLYRSYSGVKYKNLEGKLKSPQRADSVISRLPKDNIKFFERRFSGLIKDRDSDNSLEDITAACVSNFNLTKSKTDVYLNKPRASVDLEGITIDIKGKLSMFEKKEDKKPAVKLSKSQSMKSSSVSPSRTFTNNRSYIKQLSSNSDDLSDDSFRKSPEYFSTQVNCVQTIYPTFNTSVDDSNTVVTGQLKLQNQNNKTSDYDDILKDINEFKISLDAERTEFNNEEVDNTLKENQVDEFDAEKAELGEFEPQNNNNTNIDIKEQPRIVEKVKQTVSLEDLLNFDKTHNDEVETKSVSLESLLKDTKETKIDLKLIISKENGETNKTEPVYAVINKDLKTKNLLKLSPPEIPIRTKKHSNPSSPISRDVSPSRAKIHDMKMNFLQSPITNDTQPKIPSRKKSIPSPVLSRNTSNTLQEIDLRPELPPRKRTSSYAIRQHGSKEAINEGVKKEDKKIAKAHSKHKTDKDKDCAIQ